MFLFFLLLPANGSAAQILDRYAAFHKATPAFSADMVYSSQGMSLPFEIRIDGASKVNARYRSQGVDYAFNMTPAGAVEINYATRQYDEWPGRPHISLPKSNITGVLRTYPMWVYAPDLQHFIPKGATFTAHGQEVRDGVSCDVVHGHVEVQGVKFDVDAAVAPNGELRRIKTSSTTMGGEPREWIVSHWKPTTWQANAFHLEVPLGFVPYALPYAEGPIEAGQPFPLAGWIGDNGRPFDLASRLRGRGALVALIGAESEPSRAALASLSRLRGSMPVVILTDSRRPASGTDAYDPTGALVDKLAPRATPLFFIVDAKGKIIHLRMGYDAEKAHAFESDVVGAFNTRKSPS